MTWHDLVEPPVDTRLPQLLLSMGLDRHISWHHAAVVLAAYDNAGAAGLAERRARQHTQSPPADERDLALVMVITGRTFDWPKFWHGADAREAFALDLRISNPGDHSGLHLRTPEQLLQDLVILRLLPETRWRHARVVATRAERKRRAGE